MVVTAFWLAQPAGAAPPKWRETLVDQSWRDTPARVLLEDVSRQAGLRLLLDDRVALRLDAAHITLLARNQPASVILRRIGELTDMDLVIVGERLMAYEHGRVPAMLIVADELSSTHTNDPSVADESPQRYDCEWIDLTVPAIASSISKTFGVSVSVAPEIQARQELVSFTASNATLDEAIGEVCRQLQCPFGWVDGGVVIGQNGPAVPKRTAAARKVPVKKVSTPLRLSGEELTWQELAHLTEAGCGRNVILPDSQRGKSVGKLWADSDAVDVMVARALWSSSHMIVDVTNASLALQADEDEATSPE